MSMGVVRYCTDEGGSGFIANPALPWLSSWNITHQAPVYDQETAWLRDSRPGTYTNYQRFGPPYSADGGVLPPYRDYFEEPSPVQGARALDSYGQPVPVQVGGGCGMSGLGDSAYDALMSAQIAEIKAATGRNIAPNEFCLKIQCGAISQAEAGMDAILQCANAGWSGVRSCLDPLCAPFCPPRPGPAPVLLRSDVVAPMPSITSTAREGCKRLAPPECPSGIASWIESNPWLAVALGLLGGAILFGGNGARR